MRVKFIRDYLIYKAGAVVDFDEPTANFAIETGIATKTRKKANVKISNDDNNKKGKRNN